MRPMHDAKRSRRRELGTVNGIESELELKVRNDTIRVDRIDSIFSCCTMLKYTAANQHYQSTKTDVPIGRFFSSKANHSCAFIHLLLRRNFVRASGTEGGGGF
jgi:predicted nucleotidyltransferase